MKKETKIIIFQYSILLAILFIGFYSIFYFKSQKLSQIIAILGMSVGYFLWGIYRHLSEKNLYFKIVVEYGRCHRRSFNYFCFNVKLAERRI